jgi:hypothetical protein
MLLHSKSWEFPPTFNVLCVIVRVDLVHGSFYANLYNVEIFVGCSCVGGVEVFVLGGMCIIGVATNYTSVLFFCPHAFYPPFE